MLSLHTHLSIIILKKNLPEDPLSLLFAAFSHQNSHSCHEIEILKMGFLFHSPFSIKENGVDCALSLFHELLFYFYVCYLPYHHYSIVSLTCSLRNSFKVTQLTSAQRRERQAAASLPFYNFSLTFTVFCSLRQILTL